ncbi:MAG: PASTA domain-containing protein [Bacteroidaceae bacterium]|nr:PASTA domain-containing protein [Bacteroidaceae bacterium]
MGEEGKEKESKKRTIGWILLNLLIMAVLAFLLVIITFKWIESYTRHGEYIAVPDVHGMYEKEAGEALAAAGLKYEVLDYKYDKMMVEGGVIEQKPKPGAYVKDGRKIYLTLNSGKVPMRAVPDVADNSSLRAAEARLTAAGFKLGRTVYVDGDLDWVYEIRYQGEKIEAGSEIPEGSLLTIVAGNGTPVERIEEVDSTTVIDSEFFE